MAGKDQLVEEFLTASRALVGLAVQSVAESPVEVTLVQYRVLVLLAARGEQQVGDIAAALGVNPSNATRHCDRLQRLGLVARRRSTDDGRVVRVGLTDGGKQVVEAVTARRRAEVQRVVGGDVVRRRRGCGRGAARLRRGGARDLHERVGGRSRLNVCNQLVANRGDAA